MSSLPSITFALALLLPSVLIAANQKIEAPHHGSVRAMLIGIDIYRNVPQLHGAVADAEDLSLSLRLMGVEDMTLLKNGDANRDAILSAIQALTERTKVGDLVVLGIAGHGSSEPERVKGSKPSGRDEVYVLAGFDTRPPGTHERIFGDEFKTLIRAIEAKGADVLFIADTCHAGGLTRQADPRAGSLSWRQTPAYTIEQDDLSPISTVADAVSSPYDFKNLTFLAAVDDKSNTPEITIPGVAQRRGALSYATARAFQGAADRNGDGIVSRRELFEYVRQTVYQYTDERQNIFTQSAPDEDLDRVAVFFLKKNDLPLTAGEVADAQGNQTVADPLKSTQASSEAAPLQKAVVVTKIAALGGEAALENLKPALTPISKSNAAGADLVFDPAKHEAIASGDVIASDIDAADLPFVADRMATLAMLKTLAGAAPQTIRLTPSDAVYREGARVGISVPDIAGRRLVLFDVTGNGTVQFLYPVKKYEGQPLDRDFELKLGVTKPFGTDLLVAVSAETEMPDLVDFLKQNANRRTAGNIAKQLHDFLPSGARVGFTVLYTAAGAKP
ncbi:caspase domain-containing protein [Rhizobium lusitanum]|uniref:Peptidase C14 caspase domain-containing protein n=1 Tax=Rhizobium lusitanum TaxID=293958 RepID=A0A7X0MFF6_9HYPH|nr:caspase family protein [Rhizobium lusitanum]MBB6487060.1 hypothetical protein [Rhizobium lusitanum]